MKAIFQSYILISSSFIMHESKKNKDFRRSSSTICVTLGHVHIGGAGEELPVPILMLNV